MTPSLTPAPLSAGVAISVDEAKMMALLNDERVKAGLKPLSVDPTFQAVARARAADMAARKYYSHYDPVTKELAAKAMLAKLGMNVPMSENFYSTWPYNEGFVAKAMGWFMGDKVHRDNILTPRWNVVGVGIVAPQGGNPIAVQVFGMK